MVNYRFISFSSLVLHPLAKILIRSIAGPALKEYAEASKKKKEEPKPEVTGSGLTEEEERELAELLSDSD